MSDPISDLRSALSSSLHMFGSAITHSNTTFLDLNKQPQTFNTEDYLSHLSHITGHTINTGLSLDSTMTQNQTVTTDTDYEGTFSTNDQQATAVSQALSDFFGGALSGVEKKVNQLHTAHIDAHDSTHHDTGFTWDWHHPLDSIGHDFMSAGHDVASGVTGIASSFTDIFSHGAHSAANGLEHGASSIGSAVKHGMGDLEDIVGDVGHGIHKAEQVMKWVMIGGLLLVGYLIYEGSYVAKDVYVGGKQLASEVWAGNKEAINRKIKSAIELA